MTKTAIQETATVSRWSVLSAVIFFGLALSTIVTSGLSMQHSYQLSQFAEREQAALQQKQFLQEYIAEAGSLNSLQTYAEQEGFSQTVTYQASLDSAIPVAQR